MSTSTVRRKLSEASLCSRIAEKISLLRKQNNIKRFLRVKVHKDWTIDQSKNSYGLMNQSSKSFAQIGGSMCSEELVKEMHPPESYQP